MGEKIEDLILELKNKIKGKKIYNKKVGKFILKFEVWNDFFEKLLDERDNDEDIIRLVEAIKLVVLVGLAEDYVGGYGNKTLKEFLKVLNNEEKLYFLLVFEIISISNKQDLFYIFQNEGVERRREKDSILQAYLENKEEFTKKFNQKVKDLYLVRSEIVHKGMPVEIIRKTVGKEKHREIISFGEGRYPSLEDKQDIFLFFVRRDLVEFFIRAIYRRSNISPPIINRSVIAFLKEEKNINSSLKNRTINKLKGELG